MGLVGLGLGSSSVFIIISACFPTIHHLVNRKHPDLHLLVLVDWVVNDWWVGYVGDSWDLVGLSIWMVCGVDWLMGWLLCSDWLMLMLWLTGGRRAATIRPKRYTHDHTYRERSSCTTLVRG